MVYTTASSVSSHNPKARIRVFTIIPPIINLFPQRSLEHPDRVAEIQPPLGQVGLVLGQIPFKAKI